jgi:hypothetical protein
MIDWPKVNLKAAHAVQQVNPIASLFLSSGADLTFATHLATNS